VIILSFFCKTFNKTQAKHIALFYQNVC
jgi:hypothetical protein